MQEQVLAKAEASPVLIKYAALLLGLLLVMIFGVRPALRRARGGYVVKEKSKKGVKELPGPVEAAPAPALQPPAPAENDPERMRTQHIFEQVSEHLKQEPSQSSRLLQSWIHSE
jgi:flagellar M-ring protein FliF